MKALHDSTVKEWVLRNSGGQELKLRLEDGETATVGRDLSCELTVLDAGVSRHHATFQLEGDDLWLEDLHSQNGTFVNTEAVHRARVNSGDLVTFGRTSFTVTMRAEPDLPSDPLQRLSPESLAQLVRIARDFAAEEGRTVVFQRLVELALEALKADRGAIFLWEESRNHFHPVAAVPHDFFQSVSRLLGPYLARSLVRSGKARLISEPGLLGTGTALATPLFTGSRATGILYLDRAPGKRVFQATDAGFLFALAWVTGKRMESFADRAEERAAHPAAKRWSGLLAATPPGSAAWPGGLPGATEPRKKGLLLELEETLVRVEMDVLAGETGQDAPSRAALGAVRFSRLAVEAVRRLEERHTSHFAEVSVSRVIAELSGLDRERRKYLLETGAELRVLCDSADLVLSLRLGAEVLEPATGGAGSSITVSATPSSDFGMISLQLTRDPSGAVGKAPRHPSVSADGPDVSARPNLAPGARAFSERLARDIVAERLHGRFAVADDGTWVELRLPLPSVSFGETVVLPAGGAR
ncbi:MAG TPA: FHA domain-containing protein [Planctomycetota bacterium]|nr:FHA domain-containing protein [Planctomycetota bacterium]